MSAVAEPELLCEGIGLDGCYDLKPVKAKAPSFWKLPHLPEDLATAGGAHDLTLRHWSLERGPAGSGAGSTFPSLPRVHLCGPAVVCLNINPWLTPMRQLQQLQQLPC